MRLSATAGGFKKWNREGKDFENREPPPIKIEMKTEGFLNDDFQLAVPPGGQSGLAVH
jgi:hypothetical protein